MAISNDDHLYLQSPLGSGHHAFLVSSVTVCNALTLLILWWWETLISSAELTSPTPSLVTSTTPGLSSLSRPASLWLSCFFSLRTNHWMTNTMANCSALKPDRILHPMVNLGAYLDVFSIKTISNHSLVCFFISFCKRRLVLNGCNRGDKPGTHAMNACPSVCATPMTIARSSGSLAQTSFVHAY